MWEIIYLTDKKSSRSYVQRQYIAISGPMIYMALYGMLLMWANPLRGQEGGGWAQEIETFWAV
jgi:hypothetical protein